MARGTETLDFAQRIDRATEVPMLILAFIYLGVLVMEYLLHLSQGVRGERQQENAIERRLPSGREHEPT